MEIFLFLPEVPPSSRSAVITARCTTSFADRLDWFATFLTVSIDRLVMKRRISVGFLFCSIWLYSRVRWKPPFSFFFNMVFSIT